MPLGGVCPISLPGIGLMRKGITGNTDSVMRQKAFRPIGDIKINHEFGQFGKASIDGSLLPTLRPDSSQNSGNCKPSTDIGTASETACSDKSKIPRNIFGVKTICCMFPTDTALFIGRWQLAETPQWQLRDIGVILLPRKRRPKITIERRAALEKDGREKRVLSNAQARQTGLVITRAI